MNYIYQMANVRSSCRVGTRILYWLYSSNVYSIAVLLVLLDMIMVSIITYGGGASSTPPPLIGDTSIVLTYFLI